MKPINHSHQIRPLSVNEAWQGRRFKTDAYKNYETELLYNLPKWQMIKGLVAVEIKFYFKSPLRRDIDNPIKLLLDIIVKRGWIEDDRKITSLLVKKFKREVEGFKIKIKPE